MLPLAYSKGLCAEPLSRARVPWTLLVFACRVYWELNLDSQKAAFFTLAYLVALG